MSTTKSNPLLTIIMPTYNSAATLDIALESIIHQTFQNIELLIIDGLSSDNTIEIAKKYQLEFPQINIISEADKGIYDAMNKGIGVAKGEWVYFMGSDDSLYEITTLEQVLNNEKIKNLDVIYGSVYSMGFNGVYDGEFTYSKLAIKNICHQAILFRLMALKKTGKFNLKYNVLADWDHNIRWFFSSKISKSYTNQIIANFGEGGFSSKYEDEVFEKDKSFKIAIKGLRKLEKSELIGIIRNALIHAKNENYFFRIHFLLIIKHFLILERKLNSYARNCNSIF
jgi:glycosyltransferase involved in cell wall biosynthesis